MEQIKVTIIELADRSHYLMQYKDPITGRRVSKSTSVEITGKKSSRTEAERVAAKWESELREGRYHAPGKITWQEFRDRYENEVLASQSENTAIKVGCLFNFVEKILNPNRLREITTDRLSHFQAKLRDGTRSENTIAGYMAHMKSAMRWAARIGLIHKAPEISRPRRANSANVMKGRPITGEEFERMLGKVEAGLLVEMRQRKPPKGTRPRSAEFTATRKRQSLAWAAAAAESWRHYLTGLYCSGLRVGESLELYWDRDDKLCVDLSGKRPMLLIPAALEKGNKTRVLPMAPEFAEFLLKTPEHLRKGYVFNPAGPRGNRPGRSAVIHRVSAIGKAAGVKVNTVTKGGVTSVKYASAHDLRRSFGERWASRVMPQILMELMRHESIDTTLRFYVGRNAQKTADVLWAAHEAASNSLSNNAQNEHPSEPT